MTSKERLLNALLHNPVDRVPVAGLVTAINKAAMEYAGVTFRKSLASAQKYAKLAAAPYDLYGLESIKLPFGMTVEAEILGAEIDFGDDFTLPQVRKPAFNRPGDFNIPVDLSTRGRIPLVRESVRLLQTTYGGRVAIVTSIVGPFTLAGMVFGLEQLFMWMMTEPQVYKQCLECIDNGVDVLHAGCAWPPDVPHENAVAFAGAAQK